MVKKRKQRHVPSRRKRFSKSQLMGYFLIFVMVASVGAVILYNPQPQEGQQYDVVQTQQGWVTSHEGEQVIFLAPPSSVSHHGFPDGFIELVQGSPQVMLTFDPAGMREEMLGVVDYARITLRQDLIRFDTDIATGIDGNHSSYDLPQADCGDTTQYGSVIHLEQGNVTQVTETDGCFRFQANSAQGLLGLLEAFRYRVYEVI